MNILWMIFFLIISYLLGSVPFGYLIGKAKNTDITQSGSGNIGTTNTFRVLGPLAGFLAGTFDILKGGIVIVIVYLLSKYGKYNDPLTINGEEIYIIYGLAAVIGHCHSIFLKFKGGKGVATSLGAIFFINPLLGLTLLVVFLAVMLFTKYVSLASCLGAVAGVAGAFTYYPIMGQSILTPIVILIFGIIIFLRHIANFKRLANGTENKIGQKKKRLASN